MFSNKKSHQKKRRRDSYEYLCGNRFSNSKTYDSENSSLFTNDDDDSNEPIDEAKNAITDMSLYVEPDDPTLAECGLWIKNRYFTKRKLYRLLPPLRWIPAYTLDDLKGDIISGISVAFTIVPQGLALASLAGLPPQYGLYTSFVGCFVYSVLGSCKDMAVGPTSILSMIVLPYVLIGGPQYSILLAFFAGCIQLLAGLLNLGFIVDFISFPVITAFSLAASISISASQLKGFFGLHYTASRLPGIFSKFFSTLGETNYYDVILGTLCLLFLLPFQLFKDHRFPDMNWKSIPISKILNSIFQLLIIGRNAMALFFGSLIAIYYGQNVDKDGTITGNIFTLTRQITPGLPSFQWPEFSVTNGTNVIKPFSEVYEDIGTGIFVLSLVGLMESVAVANAFKSEHSRMDATQEMIALGLSNILGSFFGAFPATGSFSRSAVQHNSGARTPAGNMITGSLVLLALSTLSGYFENIPETVLATIIITSVIFMAHPSDCLLIWRTSPIDLLPYAVTLASSLFIGLEFGILIGIGFSIMVLLYHMTRPHVFTITKESPHNYPFLYVKPDRSIFFSSIEYMQIKIFQGLNKVQHRGSHKKIVVLDGEHMFRSDSTFALGMKNMVNHLKNDGITVIFYRLRRQVFRTIVGVSMHPTSFHNCRTEDEVYQLIKQINENRLKHSTSICLPYDSNHMNNMKPSSGQLMSTNFNEFGSRFHWLTQSF
ncbi:sodium-independent sulfate anion transporter-like [Dermatophagoides pteronyssinus]|uniref:sodium-independent sulfate anion transporter-like n=1 Tax=Dermatophagoides pteronyssinus TaxID=6956 RepID=UPI003F6630CB